MWSGEPGSLVGPYEILARRGAGLLGPAWVARRVDGGSERVLRVLPYEPGYAEIAAGEAFAGRARLLEALSHPALVDVVEILPRPEGVLVAEELCPAATLEERIREGGPLTWSEARPIAAQILATLEFLHQRDLLHLSIRPGNIHLVDRCGSVKLNDCGLPLLQSWIAPGGYARRAGRSGGAPELSRGLPPGPGADLYAVGALLRDMLRGLAEADPCERADASGRFDLLEIGAAPAVAGAAPPDDLTGLPEEAAMAIRACLAPDPAERPLTVRDLRVMLGFAAPADPHARAQVEAMLRTLSGDRMAGLGYAATAAPGQALCPACGRPMRPRALSCLACGHARPADPEVRPVRPGTPLLEIDDGSGGAASPPAPPEEEPVLGSGSARVDFFVAQGDRLAAQGRWEEALHSYGSAAGDETASGVAHNRRGDALTVLGRYREACDAYEQAIARNPRDWDARHDLGRVLLTLGALRQAAAVLTEVAGADTLPELRLSALTHLGSAQSRAGRLIEALHSWRRVIDEGPPNPPVLHAMGIAYAQLGHREHAETCWRQALAIDPNHAESRVALSSGTGRATAPAVASGPQRDRDPLESALESLGSLLFGLRR